MNDFSRSSTLLFSILFADDTSVFLEGTEYSKLIKTLNNELENVTKWLNANRLTCRLFPNLFQIYSKPTTIFTVIVHVTHKLFELLLVKAKQFIKHLPKLDHWLGIIYLVKFQSMCLIYVLKTMPNYIYRQIVYHKLD